MATWPMDGKHTFGALCAWAKARWQEPGGDTEVHAWLVAVRSRPSTCARALVADMELPVTTDREGTWLRLPRLEGFEVVMLS